MPTIYARLKYISPGAILTPPGPQRLQSINVFIDVIILITIMSEISCPVANWFGPTVICMDGFVWMNAFMPV